MNKHFFFFKLDEDAETTTESLRSSTIFRPTLPPYGQGKDNDTSTLSPLIDDEDKWSCRFNDELFKQGQEIDITTLKDELKGSYNCYETCYCKVCRENSNNDKKFKIL